MTQANTLIRTCEVSPTLPSRHTGWLAAYEMLFKVAGYSDINQRTISKMLIARGYSRIAETRSLGLLDIDMPYTAAALHLGTGYTNALTSIGGVRSALQHIGVLWVAMQIPVNLDDTHGHRHKHVTVVVDVDETRNKIAIVSSCKENYYDIPNKAWVDFEWFRRGVKYTQNLRAGCQFLKPDRARGK